MQAAAVHRTLFAGATGRERRLDVTGPCGLGRVARITGSAKAGTKITATWNGRMANGSLAATGRYTLTLTAHSASATARPVVRQVLVVPPEPAPVPAGTPSSGAGGYQPVTPTRLTPRSKRPWY